VLKKMLYLHYELQIVVDSIEKSRYCKKNIIASSLASEERWLARQTRSPNSYSNISEQINGDLWTTGISKRFTVQFLRKFT
jgi:hypothetical protein